jgi:hypothetical protein
MSRKHGGMSREALQMYRSAFHNMHIVLLDEVCMVSSHMLQRVHVTLQEITNDFEKPFAGINIMFYGDLRQLLPHRDSLSGAALWQSLHCLPLKRVMRQSDVVFSSILAKISSGDMLTLDEKALLESRFKSREQSLINAPNVIRLFYRNHDVEDSHTC